MSKEKKAVIIGHVGHGLTTIAKNLSESLDHNKKEPKTIHEIIEEESSIKITKTPIFEWRTTETRRERRARERKENKK